MELKNLDENQVDVEVVVDKVRADLQPIDDKDELIVKCPKVPFNDNIDLYRETLALELKEYSEMTVTASNLKEYEKATRRVVAIRTALKSQVDSVKTVLESPTKLFLSKAQTLFDLIAEVEGSMKANIDVFEEKRKKGVAESIRVQVEELQKEYNLGEEYLNRVDTGKKAFFNKTQDFVNTLSDLQMQFKSLKFEEEDKNKSIDRITAVCNNANINPEPYLRLFETTNNLNMILDNIETDKERERLNSVKQAKPEEKEFGNTNEAATDKGDYVTATCEITYSKEQGKILTEFFKQNNITFTILNKR